jgi:hypothetical protein
LTMSIVQLPIKILGIILILDYGSVITVGTRGLELPPLAYSISTHLKCGVFLNTSLHLHREGSRHPINYQEIIKSWL